MEFASDRDLVKKSLYKDALKICKKAVKENKYSSFNPFKEEYVISTNFDVDNRQISLRGKVDRIDTYDDKFRVIDYKTGKVKKNIYTDLYYGKKIQLFLYSKVLEKEIKLKPSGVYYFNARSEYQGSEDYILEGITACDIREIDTRLFDKDFKKSDIISAKQTKDGISFKEVSEKELSLYHDYAESLSRSAVSHIVSGQISPLPDENSCEYCKYRGICLYNKHRGVRKLPARGQNDFVAEVKDEI